MSEGRKNDKGKPQIGLIPNEALEEIARVMEFGASQYGVGNWTKGINYSRLIDAMYRHLGAFNSGEDKASDSNCHHIAHLAATAMFILYFNKHRCDLDDRWSLLTNAP